MRSKQGENDTWMQWIMTQNHVGHVVTLTGYILLLFPFKLLVKAVNVFSNLSLRWTFLFIELPRLLPKLDGNCRRHCCKMSSHRCHMKEWLSLIHHWGFYSFRRWGEGGGWGGAHIFIGFWWEFLSGWRTMFYWLNNWLQCNDRKCFHLSSFLWQFNHASSL